MGCRRRGMGLGVEAVSGSSSLATLALGLERHGRAGCDGEPHAMGLRPLLALTLSAAAVALNLTHLDSATCPSLCADQGQWASLCVEKGCRELEAALRLGCGPLCNGSEFPALRACQVGCSRVVEKYYLSVTSSLALPPPLLVSDSLRSSSLRLRWDGGVHELPYVALIVQRRALGRGLDWESLPAPPTGGNSTTFSISGLRPFTEYQFRIGLTLAADFPTFFSSPSNRIETLPKGTPTSPTITSIQPISNTSVSITWEPPAQPNGRLLAFVLRLQKTPTAAPIIKEIRLGGKPVRGYTFSGLEPNWNYSLSLSAQNLEGEGEPTRIQFKTPPTILSNEVKKREDPKLLLLGRRDVFVQHMDFLMEPDAPLWSLNGNLSSLAAHLKYKILFVGGEDGNIYLVGLERNDSRIFIPKDRLDVSPTFLSVDWLHDKLYVLGRKRRGQNWLIKRTDLSGTKVKTVHDGILSQPTDFAADPYTGYLYWVIVSTPPSSGGLFRMDLSGEGGRKVEPLQLIESPTLGPFTLDFPNYRVLVVDKGVNTVLAVSLDGEVVDIREKSQSPEFRDVISIGLWGGLLYWTTGERLVSEEYNAEQGAFYHNSFDVDKRVGTVRKLMILHPETQPTPVPLAPPSVPMAVFDRTRSRLSWEPPPPISGLGQGAWRGWTYFLTASNNVSFLNVSGTEFLLENLKPSTSYTFQVAAQSSSGRGPLSTGFRGKSLKDSSVNTSFVWAAGRGLWATDPLGDSPTLLASAGAWESSGTVTSIASSDSTTFFATQNGTIWRIKGRELEAMEGTGVVSLAWDYIGRRLYYATPRKQSISRLAEGEAPEVLRVVTAARELAIDSYKGVLVWSTGHSLEMSRLNGNSHSILYQTSLFSGIVLLGLALDTSQSRLYWVSRSSSGASLLRLSYNTKSPQSPIVVAIDEPGLSGPIKYFSDRLIWLEGPNSAVVSNTFGQSKSTLNLRALSNITTFEVCDPGSHRYPGGLNQKLLRVTPNPVTPWNIVLNGRWDNWTLSWASVNNTNFGKVFYEVTIGSSFFRHTSDTNVTIEYPSWPPYSEVEVNITALSYWATAKTISVKKLTPSWKPSAPQNLRFFLNEPFGEKGNLSGELRWESPSNPNGRILNYLLHCWRDRVQRSDCGCELDLVKLSSYCPNLLPDSAYEFAVQAYTDWGAGNMSSHAKMIKGESHPVPRLVISSSHGLTLLDVDRRIKTVLIPSTYAPITFTVADHEMKIYSFDDVGDLSISNFEDKKKIRLLTLNSVTPSHLTLDWIGQKLYWTFEKILKSDEIVNEKYGIMSADLSTNPPVLSTVLSSRNVFTGLAIDPFSNRLFFTRARRIYSVQTTGEVGSFFSPSPRCNCSSLPAPNNQLFFKSSLNLSDQGLLFGQNGNIWKADIHGCLCTLLIERLAEVMNLGMDEPYLYWVDSMGNLKGKNKRTGTIHDLSRDVSALSVIGGQKWPDKKCLIPSHLEPKEPILVNATSNGLSIRLPEPKCNACPFQDISMPTSKYSIYYGPVDERGASGCSPDSVSSCRLINSTSNLVTIDGLSPFTTHTLFVVVQSYYGSLLTSSPIVVRTAAGAPMPPKLLKAEPISPTALRVSWAEPEKLNGEKVWYEVQWKKEGGGGDGQVWAVVDPIKENRSDFSYDVCGLSPSAYYSVSVVAFSEKGDSFSSTPSELVSTLPFPNNLTLIHRSPHSLNFSWTPHPSISRYQFLYRQASSRNLTWSSTELREFQNKTPILFSLDNLNAKTSYLLQTKAWYSAQPDSPLIFPENGERFETWADKPGPPGVPIVRSFGPSYEVIWEKAEENGATVEAYTLEAREGGATSSRMKRSFGPQTVWQLVYNGSECQWAVAGLQQESSYSFRVRAKNGYGWGSWSRESGLVTLTSRADPPVTILYGLCGLAFLLVIITIGGWFIWRERKKGKQECATELATLSELPAGSAFQNNGLYVGGELLAGVPKLRREEVNVGQLLGRGAFGEVYEGLAWRGGSERRVAIKSLKKGASETEKAEFAEEAKTMAQFHHPHILELIGVVDTDPPLLLLELMTGGDLLAFLRTHRPSVAPAEPLTIIDLVAITEDVARGCVYLEELHFVHRDLAARNCLVQYSTSNDGFAGRWVVKIGDFGLARDIYRNDYYRKEGEGLLPVRWMSPEALIDGLCTTQSDVWAFGVLIWEVMTMGQQPYPAMSNLDVFHYVRNGGTLPPTTTAPPHLTRLMGLCWEYRPDDRPSFKDCLSQIQTILVNLIASPPSSPGQEEEKEAFGVTYMGRGYLELISDSASMSPLTDSDGYEVPLRRAVGYSNAPTLTSERVWGGCGAENYEYSLRGEDFPFVPCPRSQFNAAANCV